MQIRLRGFFRAFIMVALISAFWGCGLVGKGVKVSYPNKVNSEMKAAFDQAENDFKVKNYKQAQEEYQSYIQRFPYNALSDLSQFRIGQILMLGSQYQAATDVFAKLIEKTPDPEMASRARVKAGICQYRMGKFSDALAYFDKADGQYIRDHDKIKMGSLAIVSIDKLKAAPERKGYYWANLLDGYADLSEETIQQKYAPEAPTRKDVLAGLQTWSGTRADISQIDSRFKTYKPTVSEPYVDFKLGMANFVAGDTKPARKYLETVVNRYPQFAFYQKASETLEKIGFKPEKAKGGGQAYKIGVILPMTGKYQSYGTSTLNGMQCAASLKSGCTGVSNIQLVTRDDQGDPTRAAQAVEELVKQEKVIAIVGPLSSASAVVAAQKAQELGVPMISLAQKEGIPEIGGSIFRFSLTPNEQVEALLKYVTKIKGKKLFAVLYPNSNYGKVFLDTMKQLAANYGASVTASKSYGNLTDPANELRQLKFSVEKTTPDAPMGFNGIFIPDSYVAVLKIAPSLKNSGMDGVLLMGTNAWDDPSLTKAGDLLADSIFLDIYFKDSENPRVKAFVQEYSSAFGQPPATLEAMGYDVVRFLGKALERRKASSFTEMRDIVASMRGYDGVTGLRSFLSDREADVEPFLLTIQGNQIKEIH